jgi:hypothetical protein
MASVDELFEAVMKLPEGQRQELVDRVFQSSLPEVPGEVVSEEEAEASWLEEIKRRCEQMDRGEVELKDAFESLDEIRRKLRAERLANATSEASGR